MCPSKVAEGETRGWIVPIGGAENKENDQRILRRFVDVSGGKEADIVVIPTASKMHETGPRYEALFRELGAGRVTVMDFDTRRDCQEPNRLQRLEEATVIFFTGGNQLRLTALLGGTPVTIHRYVKGCDAAFKRAVDAGATVKMPVEDMFWGDRYSVVVDPFGHTWSLATHQRDLSPDEIAKEMQAAFAQPVS